MKNPKQTPEILMEQAQSYLNQLSDILSSYAPKPIVSKPFRECAELWLDYRRTKDVPASINVYKSSLNYHLIPYFGDTLVSDITKQNILDFKLRLRRNPVVKAQIAYSSVFVPYWIMPLIATGWKRTLLEP